MLDELCAFKVLDPACGCGNFLYVAYRELRGLEFELKQRMSALAKKAGIPEPAGPLPFYPLTNVRGIDIEGIAVLIARVTLWMGHRQMIDRYGEAEPVLPLVDLSGIQRADALRATWPEVELLVNPNGPLSDAGSRKDNGQTGRKPVMDYYGPRVPLGGGAIYGKDPMHVDRFGARKAREMAIDAVKRGAGECLVQAVYAPNVSEPLDVQVEITGGGDVRVDRARLVLAGELT